VTNSLHLKVAFLMVIGGVFAGHGAPGGEKLRPLAIHPQNGRYFTDGTRLTNGVMRAVYLTGSHTWPNLIDRGPSDPPPQFNFEAYLDLLRQHNHNFIRLWSRQVSWYHEYGQGELHATPLAWPRTGPGQALDGKPRFDLSRLNENYFQRLRARVSTAGERGIYVAVMLFGGNYECTGGWAGNPFHAQNNINGIDGDPARSGHGLKSHTLEIPGIVKAQEKYVRKVVETLNDLDNVLFEISNEGHASSAEWQKHWIQFIRDYERSQPKQHPVGMTALYIDDPKENARLLQSSSADWISPLTDAQAVRNIPAADGSKVSLVDSDHWFVKELYRDPSFGREWVWKAFCRGHNPILMEHLPPQSFIDPDYPVSLDDPGYTASRQAMGHTRRFAERMNLAAMKPRGDLSSTGFCLADPGNEYLAYRPEGPEDFFIHLEPGKYQLEFFDPAKGASLKREPLESPGGRQKINLKTEADLVIYLKRSS
jgi:hypothetical protein